MLLKFNPPTRQAMMTGEKMKHVGLFEGIGGFSLAARWAGWETIAWCEINPFGQKVLKYHFPKATGHADIKSTDFTIYRGMCDILTGGFPCQPYSAAGKRLGTEDDRHLWPEMLRAIREIQPSYVVGENVRGLTNWNGGLVFDQVQADLEAEGYEVLPFLLPACAVNAPHRRDRIWFVAYCDGLRGNKKYELQQSKICEQHGKGWPPSNPNLSTTGTPGESGSPESNWSNHNDEPEQRGGKTELNTGSHEFLRNASDTGLQRPPISEKQTARFEQCDKGVASNSNGSGREKFHPSAKSSKQNISSRDVMYPDSTSEQRQYFGQEREGKPNRPNSRNGISAWQNFPNQPPICGGNDGISSRLDGITFPKWRNESIKAYGNAIVPQVAFEIFKVIQDLHSHPSQTQT